MQLRPDTAKAMSLVQHLLHNVVEKTESAKSKHSHIPSPAFSLLICFGMPENLHQTSSVGNTLIQVQ